MKSRVLVVEDDKDLLNLLMLGIDQFYEVEGVGSGEEAIARVTERSFDVALVDVLLPGKSGIELIPLLHRIAPQMPIIVASGYSTISMAVEAMKNGAVDFIDKPFSINDLLDKLSSVITRPANNVRKEPETGLQLIAKSVSMQEILEQVTSIAPFNTTALITGETGTGKEMIAHLIHQQSNRAKKPFVALNCAAIPEHLLEDELFGHVKGAFTGAQNSREGRFEQAQGGTLFLDEIGDMSLPLQSKLLRVLQEREFEKLGSGRTVKADVRIIAATSADLEKRMEDGSFRPDLYYRLNVVRLHLPSLRERSEDIAPLAEHLLVRFCDSIGLPAKQLEQDIIPVLMQSKWPGNIRQLQNAMERAAVLSGMRASIGLKDLPPELRNLAIPKENSSTTTGNLLNSKTIPEQGVNFEEVVTEIERELLCQSLKKASGNKMRAAKLLNMKRTTFVEKLKRLGINDTAQDDLNGMDDEDLSKCASL